MLRFKPVHEVLVVYYEIRIWYSNVYLYRHDNSGSRRLAMVVSRTANIHQPTASIREVDKDMHAHDK